MSIFSVPCKTKIENGIFVEIRKRMVKTKPNTSLQAYQIQV